jgi:hypothetical protein
MERLFCQSRLAAIGRGAQIGTRLILSAWAAIAALVGSGNAMEVAKIQVSPSGDIVIDGHGASLQQLERTLAREKKNDGEIWYYREPPTVEPTDAQIRVFTIIMNSGLHVSFSTRPDFSDWVDDEGQSHPRNP